MARVPAYVPHCLPRTNDPPDVAMVGLPGAPPRVDLPARQRLVGHRHRLVVAGHRVPPVVAAVLEQVDLVVAVGAVLDRPQDAVAALGEALDVAVAVGDDVPLLGVGGVDVAGCRARGRRSSGPGAASCRPARSGPAGLVPIAASPVPTLSAPVSRSMSSRQPPWRPLLTGRPASRTWGLVTRVCCALIRQATTRTSRAGRREAALAGVDPPVVGEVRVDGDRHQPGLAGDPHRVARVAQRAGACRR